MSKKSPWTTEILRLLEERPRTRDELVAAASPLVPAGRAFRVHESMRAATAKYGGFELSPSSGSSSFTIEVGRRHIINRTLYNLANGRAEITKSREKAGSDLFRIAEKREPGK